MAREKTRRLKVRMVASFHDQVTFLRKQLSL